MLTFFILGDILGAGIYSLTGEVGKDAGGAIWASFLIAFVLAFMTAFAYLEMVTKYPQAAGAALYCDRAFGLRLLSFLVTFAVMASGVTSASFAASGIGGRYFTGLTGIEDPPMVVIAILAILLVAAVNLWGVSESAAGGGQDRRAGPSCAAPANSMAKYPLRIRIRTVRRPATFGRSFESPGWSTRPKRC